MPSFCLWGTEGIQTQTNMRSPTRKPNKKPQTKSRSVPTAADKPPDRHKASDGDDDDKQTNDRIICELTLMHVLEESPEEARRQCELWCDSNNWGLVNGPLDYASLLQKGLSSSGQLDDEKQDRIGQRLARLGQDYQKSLKATTTTTSTTEPSI